MARQMQGRRDYQAPALDKGLEIIEFLADKTAPYGMMDIAAALGRSRNEIYRMLVVLERRGYLERLSDDRYELSNRLFELGMRIPPRRNLHDAALPVMHRLAETVFQSCHLVVPSEANTVVVARVESPDLLGFAVRVGYHPPPVVSTSARLLFAFQSPAAQERTLAALRKTMSQAQLDRLSADGAEIRARGYHIGPSPAVDAITDIGAPVFDGVSEGAVASLVIPFVSGSSARSSIEEALRALLQAAERIGDELRHG
jgi:DNA-binding IclR family transcriptional regulator